MLSKNTITIRFIRVFNNAKKGYYLKNDPLSSKYDFYVSPKVRKSLDIGTVIKADTTNYMTHQDNQTIYGVIVDNKTEWKSSDKHTEITMDQVYQNGHLRTFLTNEYGIKRNSRLSNKIYHRFRTRSHNYWVAYFKAGNQRPTK